MATTTKKELTNRIAHQLGLKQMLVRDVVQAFLDLCVQELRAGNRLEFRDFGVFETVARAARKARNPKTGEEVHVPPKTVVDFKMGKRMKIQVNETPAQPAGPPPASAPHEAPQPAAAASPPLDEPSADPTAPPPPGPPPESDE